MAMAQQAQPAANRALVFRAADDVGAPRREVIAAVRQLNASLQLPDGMPLDERLLRQMAPQQFGVFVLGSLGAIALLLTVLGTYVLAETMTVMRTRELGIRAALGATSKSLTILVLRESVVLVGIWAGRWVAAFLSRSERDPRVSPPSSATRSCDAGRSCGSDPSARRGGQPASGIARRPSRSAEVLRSE
jgi:hypothetical protein